jgi:hypothetical protein
MSQKPKKERRPKLKRINVSAKTQWKHILKDVDKDEIPISLLLGLTVNLIDGTKVNIDIKELLKEGNDPEALEDLLDKKLREMDDYIEDIDFYISLDDVVRTVQPITDRILKDL